MVTPVTHYTEDGDVDSEWEEENNSTVYWGNWGNWGNFFFYTKRIYMHKKQKKTHKNTHKQTKKAAFLCA